MLVASTCQKMHGGKSLTLLLGGYDEYPSNLQENSSIAEILQCSILPYCGLVVSSRPVLVLQSTFAGKQTLELIS